ncbi:MAG: hypothetical protein Q4G67_07310, partial [Actinomycetia bacterium]|nr:hypothetical protein [Actinomycetes bacterium]
MGAVATDTGPRARVNGAAGSSGSAGGPGGRSAGRARGRGWLFSGLGSRSRRLLAAALAAAIGTAFLATSIIMLSTANAGMAEAVSVGLSEADLVVTPGIDRADGSFSTADREALAALPEVGRVVTDTETSMRWDDSH